MRGWLKKRSPAPLHAMQRRFFVLQEGSLSYYRTSPLVAEGLKPKGVIHMCNVRAVRSTDTKIEIDAGVRTYILEAASASEATAWVYAIEFVRGNVASNGAQTCRHESSSGTEGRANCDASLPHATPSSPVRESAVSLRVSRLRQATGSSKTADQSMRRSRALSVRGRASSMLQPIVQTVSRARRIARSFIAPEMQTTRDALPEVWVASNDAASGPAGRLVVTLHRATELMADGNGVCNPFVVCRVLRRQYWQSRTCWHTTSPTWEQVHEFEGFLTDLANSGISLTVFSRSVLRRSAQIGSVSIFLRDLLHGRQLTFSNVRLDGIPTGILSFSVRFELKPVFSLFPGTPVHASAAQALNRQPPTDASRWERRRDALLLLLAHKVFLYIAIIWLLTLLGFGAFIGVLHLGVYVLPPNALGMDLLELQFYTNVMTGLFSYLNLLTLPWRLSVGVHLWCSCGRSSEQGSDFYGRPTEAIWFHIPPRPRGRIVFCLLASTVFHYGSQASRIVWSTYEGSNTIPGSIPNNVTFVLSVGFAITGGVLQGIHEKRLVKQHPERYPPTVLDVWKEMVRRWRRGELRLFALRKVVKETLDLQEEQRSKWYINEQMSRIRAQFGSGELGSGKLGSGRWGSGRWGSGRWGSSKLDTEVATVPSTHSHQPSSVQAASPSLRPFYVSRSSQKTSISSSLGYLTRGSSSSTRAPSPASHSVAARVSEHNRLPSRINSREDQESDAPNKHEVARATSCLQPVSEGGSQRADWAMESLDSISEEARAEAAENPAARSDRAHPDGSPAHRRIRIDQQDVVWTQPPSLTLNGTSGGSSSALSDGAQSSPHSPQSIGFERSGSSWSGDI